MRFLVVAGCAVAMAGAAEVNLAGMGQDLNGWADGVGRYGVSGGKFEVGQPAIQRLADGGLKVDLPVRELRGATAVYEAVISVTASQDGIVRTATASGEVDGRSFETGEVTRPEPVVVEAAAAEGTAATAAAVPAPLSPDAQMRADLLDQLAAAIERARTSEKVVKRDLTSWIFTRSASADEVLVEGTKAAVTSLFRRVGP